MYSDDELHEMCEKARAKGDDLLAVAIMAVAMARDTDSEEELEHLNTMFCGYLVAKQEAVKNIPHKNHPELEFKPVDPSGIQYI